MASGEPASDDFRDYINTEEARGAYDRLLEFFKNETNAQINYKHGGSKRSIKFEWPKPNTPSVSVAPFSMIVTRTYLRFYFRNPAWKKGFISYDTAHKYDSINEVNNKKGEPIVYLETKQDAERLIDFLLNNAAVR